MTNVDVKNGEGLQAQTGPLKSKQPSLRKLKMLLALPLLMLPFLTLAFWALGGGKGAGDSAKLVDVKEGLNLDLPSANIKNDGNEDKLTFYEKAQQQEEKSKDALQNDSLFKLHGSFEDPNQLDDVVANSPSQYDPAVHDAYGMNTSPIRSEKYKDATEDKIMERLKHLQLEINKPHTSTVSSDEGVNGEKEDPGLNTDVDRLEGMMQMLQEKKADDPEMQKLEGMLDKILDIQHPDRVKERTKEKSVQQKTNAFPVVAENEKQSSTLLTSDTGKHKPVRDGFYGLRDQNENEATQNAVEAVVHETQTLVNGSNIKLRLTSDIYVNGTFIPKGNFVFGVTSLQGERLQIEIKSIRYQNSIFPVNLAVYDLDGLTGINIPGAITRDVAKQSADNSLQNVQLSTFDPSLAAQATAAGINTAKSLISKKVKLVKVMVKAGYKVLLWNEGTAQ